MSRFVAYAQPDKRKSQQVLKAFIAGSGGRMASTTANELLPGTPVFYGVRPAWAHLWEQAEREGRDWYYIDNSYFDVSRETSFRVTRNALQCDGLNACWSGKGSGRLAALGVTVKPWRTSGSHVVVCPQSLEFLSGVGGSGPDWSLEAVTALRRHTGRHLVIRHKGEKRPLADDLKGAWALVTHMSCAAVEALIAGIPVFCTGRCSARWLGSGDLSTIETPYYGERREEWAAVLAENQWTLAEFRDGTAGRDLRLQT